MLFFPELVIAEKQQTIIGDDYSRLLDDLEFKEKEKKVEEINLSKVEKVYSTVKNK